MNATKQTTVAEFIANLGIRTECAWADRNPHMDESEWSRAATHWKVTFKMGRRQMTVYFSQGAAHTSEPKAEDVLDCLASDAVGLDNARSFEDWAAEYGYDTDSRKAERTFKACKRQYLQLLKFLGERLALKLMYETERQ